MHILPPIRKQLSRLFEKGAAVVITTQPIEKIPNIVVANLDTALSRTAVFIKSALGMWTVAVMDSPEKINPLSMIEQMLSCRMETVHSISVTNNYNSMLHAMFASTPKNRGGCHQCFVRKRRKR